MFYILYLITFGIVLFNLIFMYVFLFSSFFLHFCCNLNLFYLKKYFSECITYFYSYIYMCLYHSCVSSSFCCDAFLNHLFSPLHQHTWNVNAFLSHLLLPICSLYCCCTSFMPLKKIAWSYRNIWFSLTF